MQKTMEEQAFLLNAYMGSGASVKIIPPARSPEELRSWVSNGYGVILRVNTSAGGHVIYVQRMSDDGKHFMVSDSADGVTRLYDWEHFLRYRYDLTIVDANNGV